MAKIQRADEGVAAPTTAQQVSGELEEIGETITLWCNNAECTRYDTKCKLLRKSRVDSNIDNRYCAATVVSWLHCWMRYEEEEGDVRSS
jgi:hypothetical protein